MAKSRLMDYAWMITYTPQEEWIERKGLLLWLAFFFSEIGAGIYFVSIFVNFPKGWVVGWVIALVLGGIAHILYLGSPMGIWRIFLRPGSSELSRGSWIYLFFCAVGFFQILPVLISDLPWSGRDIIMKTSMGIICVFMMSHGFLTLSMVKAIPFWHSPMLIFLGLGSGIWVGSQITGLSSFYSGADLNVAELWSRWSLFSYICVLFIFIWGARHSSEAARASTDKLLKGSSSARFYIGVVIIGILIPLIITLFAWRDGVYSLSSSMLVIRVICVIIGDLTMRYNIMKCAVYSPLI